MVVVVQTCCYTHSCRPFTSSSYGPTPPSAGYQSAVVHTQLAHHPFPRHPFSPWQPGKDIPLLFQLVPSSSSAPRKRCTSQHASSPSQRPTLLSVDDGRASMHDGWSSDGDSVDGPYEVVVERGRRGFV